MRNHSGIPSYFYNASNRFRKHRSPQDYGQSLLRTGAVGISHRASPQRKIPADLPLLISPDDSDLAHVRQPLVAKGNLS